MGLFIGIGFLNYILPVLTLGMFVFAIHKVHTFLLQDLLKVLIFSYAFFFYIFYHFFHQILATPEEWKIIRINFFGAVIGFLPALFASLFLFIVFPLFPYFHKGIPIQLINFLLASLSSSLVILITFYVFKNSFLIDRNLNHFFDAHRTSGPWTALTLYFYFAYTFFLAAYRTFKGDETQQRYLHLYINIFLLFITCIPFESSESQLMVIFIGIGGLIVTTSNSTNKLESGS